MWPRVNIDDNDVHSGLNRLSLISEHCTRYLEVAIHSKPRIQIPKVRSVIVPFDLGTENSRSLFESHGNSHSHWIGAAFVKYPKAHIRQGALPDNIGAFVYVLRYFVPDSRHQMARLLLIHLLSAGLQLCDTQLSSAWMDVIVAAYRKMTIKTYRDAIVQIVRAILIQVRKFDANPALLPTKTAPPTTPQQGFVHILRSKIFWSFCHLSCICHRYYVRFGLGISESCHASRDLKKYLTAFPLFVTLRT
jgi:hypothetical protein